MSDTIDNLPDGWATYSLNSVVAVNPPKPSQDTLSPDDQVTFVPMPAVDADMGVILNPECRPFGNVRKGYTGFIENDVIFAKITPCMENGKAAIARNLLNGMGFGSTEFHVLRSQGGILSDYLYHYIRQSAFRRDAEQHMTGSVGQKRVPKDFLESALIPLAPLPEQKRIAEKVERLLARVAQVRGRLDRAPALLKRFRQSVLAAACSGKLTEDWREQHPDHVCSDILIDQLKQERLSKSRKDRAKLESLYLYQENNDSDLLPTGWQYAALNKLCEKFEYGSSKKSLANGKVAVLRMGNLQNGKIDWSNLKYTSDAEEVKKYSLVKDTVLFNRTNSPELVGKTAIYKGEKPVVFAGYLIRINNFRNYLSSDYLNYCLNSPAAKDFCSMAKTDGVSQSNINAQKLGLFEVPYCSLEEQEEIVRRVEKLLALADKIEARLKQARGRAETITQAILAKAFCGELVPTEAELARQANRAYETAQHLLDRIQAERQSGRTPRKARIQKKTKRYVLMKESI